MATKLISLNRAKFNNTMAMLAALFHNQKVLAAKAGVDFEANESFVFFTGPNGSADSLAMTQITINGDVLPAGSTGTIVPLGVEVTYSITAPDMEIVSGSVTPQSDNLQVIAALIPTAAPVAVTGVTVLPTTASIVVGATTTIKATVAPANASNPGVAWTSSDATKATVDANGVVTGVAAGSANITATTADGSKAAACTVTVTAA